MGATEDAPSKHTAPQTTNRPDDVCLQPREQNNTSKHPDPSNLNRGVGPQRWRRLPQL